MAKVKICLDAGHYGKYNRSPVVKSYYESDMNWKLHLLLKEELESYGFEVIQTRANQSSVLSLTSRGKVSKGCDLFMSIHSNACNTESVDYPVVIVQLHGKGDALGEKLAECIEAVMGTKQDGRTYKKKGSTGGEYYGVLRGAAAVGTVGMILEHSFHTNTRAANWLLNDGNLAKLAKAEAAVIAEHFGMTKTESEDSAFLVKVLVSSLNIRKGAGVENAVSGVIKDKGIYTIVDTAKAKDGGTWGKLKSGAGWINISAKYVKKV